jgi:membrane fusion protein (multidrug efflux system)
VNTRNLLLRPLIEDGEGLLPGMFARLRIDLDRERRLVFVPETAVSYSLQGDLVYVIERATRACPYAAGRDHRRRQRRTMIAILSGISAGERVVIAGQNKLYRGARVQIDD